MVLLSAIVMVFVIFNLIVLCPAALFILVSIFILIILLFVVLIPLIPSVVPLSLAICPLAILVVLRLVIILAVVRRPLMGLTVLLPVVSLWVAFVAN